MTVAELTKRLQRFDQDRIVVLQVNAQQYILTDIQKSGTAMLLLMPPTYHDNGDQVEHWYNEEGQRFNVR